jgi:hypothetical protein
MDNRPSGLPLENVPAYLQLDTIVSRALSSHFKEWAFEVYFGSHSVRIHDKRNLAKAKEIIKDALGVNFECYRISTNWQLSTLR